MQILKLVLKGFRYEILLCRCVEYSFLKMKMFDAILIGVALKIMQNQEKYLKAKLLYRDLQHCCVTCV